MSSTSSTHLAHDAKPLESRRAHLHGLIAVSWNCPALFYDALKWQQFSNRPQMRAKFCPSSSLFFAKSFVRTKHMFCLEFLSPANNASNLNCFDIGNVSVASSNLCLFQRFLETKPDFCVLPCFAPLKTRTTDGRRQENCLKSQPGPPPKVGTSLTPTSSRGSATYYSGRRFYKPFLVPFGL